MTHPRWLVCLAALAPVALDAQTVDDVRRLAAAGDTAGAIAAAEAVLRKDRRNAEAHYLAGGLYLSRHEEGARVSAPRRKAEEHFRYATRFAPDSARYWLALADLFRADDVLTVRAQVPGLIGNAVDVLGPAPSDSLTAEVGFRVARVQWERHEHYGRRSAAADAGEVAIAPAIFAEWKYWEEFFERGVREVPVSGESLARAEAALWQVVRVRPGDVRCTGLLAVALGESGRWEEAVPVARRLVRTVPDSGRAWAILGMTYARTGRWRDSEAAFDTALARMTAAEAAPYRDIGRIMRRADRLRWDTLPEAGRAPLDSLYWQVAQPLVLSGQNEVQAEFYARLTYVEHRWSDPWVGYGGHETDIGTVYVAYGPPDYWMVFERERIIWIYLTSQFRFQFSLTPGYARARFAGESREALRLAQEASPARFDNVPLYRTLDTILVQAAQFRDRADRTSVLVFGAIPVARMLDLVPLADLELATGAVVTDSVGRELQRDRRAEVVRPAVADDLLHRSWRLALPTGAYLLRAEAHLPAMDRGARGTEPLDVRLFPSGPLALSDVLAADRVEPRDTLARRWRDFFLEPNGGRFLPGDSVALLWEIYDLVPDSLGMADYEVELRITVEAIERRSVFAQIVGGLGDAAGLTAEGDDRVTLDYTRRAPVGPDGTVVEHVTVELRDAPEGRYTIGVTVLDRRTGATATRERAVLVRREPPRRQIDYGSFR